MRSDMMFRKDQDLPWDQCLAKHLQYIYPVVTLWTCVIIFDEIIHKQILFGNFFCDLDFSFIFTKNTCFLCTICSNVTVFCSFTLKETVQNTLQKREVCTKFIITIMENNQLHKSGANRMLYNVSMKGLPLSPRMFI